MNVLFLGDVIGAAGCRAVEKHLPELKKKYSIDACIINGDRKSVV